jgi:hypothetical protein
MTTDELKVAAADKDRESLVRCAADAFEALKVIPGVDPNGPILVWLSEHLLQIRRKGARG